MPRGQPRRLLTDVDVRARGGAAERAAERDEGNAGFAEEREERLALRAVGVQRHVERVPVVEAEAVVHGRLAPRADGQGPAEAALEEEGDRCRARQREGARARGAR